MIAAPSEPLLYAFDYTLSGQTPQPTFIVAGAGEMAMNRRVFVACDPAALGAASRNELGEDFIQALSDDFEKNGPGVIEWS
jgi:hypothetical protein